MCPGWTCPPTVGLVWLWLGHMDKWSVVAQKEGPLGPECILDPRGRGRWPTPGLLWPPAFWSDSGCWFPPPGPGCCRVCFCSVWSSFGWHTRLTHGVSQGLHREGLHFSDQYMNIIQGNKPFNSFNCYGVELVVSYLWFEFIARKKKKRNCMLVLWNVIIFYAFMLNRQFTVILNWLLNYKGKWIWCFSKCCRLYF